MRVFPKVVTTDAESMTVDGRRVVMTAEKDPARIPWGSHGVDVVVESTGKILTREALSKHLAAGARRVVLTVPAKDEIDATIVVGVNDGELRPEHRIVSNASCTTNCLAPLAMILDEHFGIEEGLMTTVHAYTNDQRLADVPHKDLRRSRAAAENMIPTTTGAAKTRGQDSPAPEGAARRHRHPSAGARRLDRGPDLPSDARRDSRRTSTPRCGRPRADRSPASSSTARSPSSPPTSSGTRTPRSSTRSRRRRRATAGRRSLAWYDNEWGYSNRVVDLIDLLAAL